MTPRKPLWQEGMVLTPQHLQFQDRYHEELLHERLRVLGDHGFGLGELDIDERALARGELRVRHARGLFPDGTFVEVSEGGEVAVPPRALDAQTPSGTLVYLALPKGEAGPGAPARFVPEKMRIADFVTGESPIDVTWARPRVGLVLSTDALEGYDLLPLARIARAPGGEPVLAPDYVPPLLHVRASALLLQQLRRVVHALRAGQTTLLEQRRRAPELDGPAALRLLLLTLLGELGPRLADVVERPHVQPETAYEVLVELCGGLGAFDASLDPKALPPYRHGDLAGTFFPLVDGAVRTLGRLAAHRFVQIPLQRPEQQLHYAELAEPAVFRHEFFLAATGLDEATLREQLPRILKIACWDEMRDILHAATSGVRVAHEYRPPPVLPLRPGVVYFRIERAGTYWETIVRKGNMAIVQPLEPAKVQLELYAVDPSQVV
ncbi:MAG: type VI secretion system baseplate subunit TssK [Myxococcales bacterium]|nr:type VI secretion system baseplate subunit TssK [Myxococcales bacterium]